MSKKLAMPVLTEAEEQTLLFRWADLQLGRWPELDMLFHVPNGGKRLKSEAARLQAMGVKPGVPDIFLPVPRGGFHGLWIEMKRRRDFRVSKDQTVWLLSLKAQGYQTAVAHGWEEARDVILTYLEGYLQQ